MSGTLRPILQNEILGDLEKYLINDGNLGMPTAFECLNQFYSLKKGGITDWTGKPASGKSYFALELLMAQSEKWNFRHGLFVPDIGSEKEIIAKLVKMYTGKDFNNKYQNKIPHGELVKALPWIFDHFIIFKKSDFKKGITPIAFWEKILTYKDSAGELDTGFCDSWKNLKHEYSNREDLYLDEMLSIRNEMFEESTKHIHTIAHASKTEKVADPMNKSKVSSRIPTAEDIKGGNSWNANGKNIITVDRPNDQLTDVDIYVQKVKPEDVGKKGSVIGKLKLNPRRGRYYEFIKGFGNKYAYEYEKIERTGELDFEQKVSVEQSEFEDAPF